MNLTIAVARFLLSDFEEPFEIWILIHKVSGGESTMVVVDLEAKVSGGIASFPAKNFKQTADAITIVAASF